MDARAGVDLEFAAFLREPLPAAAVDEKALALVRRFGG